MKPRLPYGTKVRLQNIPDEDADLNGRTGVLCPKHTYGSQALHMCYGDVGVKLDIKGTYYTKVNVNHGEYVEV